jgi:hypothetical protein
MMGQCKLCGQYRELLKSHIWPSFAYKRYASDLAMGGKFADLGQQQMHNRQYTKQWMCSECEQNLSEAEKYTALLLTRLEANPDAPHQYDEPLLPFVTSMSWRATLYHTEAPTGEVEKKAERAMRRWREYLVGSPKVGPGDMVVPP